MAFSTSGRVRAWRFEDLDPQMFAERHRWRSAEIGAQMAKLKARLSDPAWIDATLAKLPVPALALLATLVRTRGPMQDNFALSDASQDFGIPIPELIAATSVLLDEGVMVVLRDGRSQAFSLVEPSAQLLAERLGGADMTPLPEGVPFVASDRIDDGRALLAACSALRFQDVKLTQSGLPHRAGVKRVAKTIGISEDILEKLVTLGVALELLEPMDDELLRPVTRRLLTLARGGAPVWQPLSAAFVERLRASGAPVSVQQIARWQYEAGMTTPSPMPAAGMLGSIPGICAGHCGDVDALRAVPLTGSAAASITPSFEVFVPPESRHEDIVAVLGCAELVRIDRMIVARITKHSIQRAAATGASATTILASLSSACRTEIPQNVAAAIGDWATSHNAITAVGRVIVVPASEHARVLTHLAPHEPTAIGPGVLVVPATVSQRAVATALARIGIATSGAETAISEVDDDKPMVSLDHLPPLEGGDPAIRRRIAAYRAERATIAKTATVSPLDDESSICSVQAIERIERWEGARRCRLPDEAATIAGSLLDVISDADQRFLLDAKNTKQMIDRIDIVMTQRGGLEAFLAKNRDFVKQGAGPETVDMVDAALTRSALTNASARGPATAAPLAWITTDLRAHLAAAAQLGATYRLDLGATQLTAVRIRETLDRGKVTMVLGERVEDDTAIAVPLHSIVRIAEVREAAPVTWRPLPGQQAPAGHLPCPCGSGTRYRSCCRPKN